MTLVMQTLHLMPFRCEMILQCIYVLHLSAGIAVIRQDWLACPKPFLAAASHGVGRIQILFCSLVQTQIFPPPHFQIYTEKPGLNI